MKFLKGLLIAFATIVVIFLILNLFGPSHYKIERSKTIDASISIVFEKISKFKNWDAWSPWKEKDNTAKYSIEGEDGSVGAIYKWSGNPETTGEGSITVTELIENEKFGYDLAFISPWESQSKGYFSFEEKNGKTNISWVDEGDIPFMQRAFMLFLDLDALMGPDFERGLEKIDSISTLKSNSSASMDASMEEFKIEEVEFPGGTYIGIHHKTTTKEAMSEKFYETNFGKIGLLFGKNNLQMTGPPVSITYQFDMEKDICEVAPAFPTDSPIKLEGEFELITIDKAEALLVKHFGKYTSVGKSHRKINDYLVQHGLKHSLVIEEYANDPSEVSEEEILTNIYYILE